MSSGNIQMGPKYRFLFFSFRRTLAIPKMLLKNNLGDDQKTGISRDVRSAFVHKFLKK